MERLSIAVQPDLRRKRIGVVIDGLASDESVRLSVDSGPPVDGGAGRSTLELPEFVRWSLDNPHCYVLNCQAPDRDGQVEIPFGMREFRIKDHQFDLNGNPFFVKGLALTPELLADSSESVEERLERIKDAGFNLIRLDGVDGRGVEAVRRVLDSANAIGLLASIALATECCTDSESLDAVVRVAVNDPSFVMWELPADAADESFALLQERDPTRIVLSPATTERLGRAARPYHAGFVEWDSPAVVQNGLLDAGERAYLGSLGGANRLVFVRSAITPGLPARDSLDANALEAAAESIREKDLGRGLTDYAVIERSADVIRSRTTAEIVTALRGNKKISGYCFDGDDGALLSRLDAFRSAQQPFGPVIALERSVVYVQQEFGVEVSLVNDGRLEGPGEISLSVIGPTGQTLWKKNRGFKIPKAGKAIWSGSIAASRGSGSHRFVVRVNHENVSGEGTAHFFAIDRAARLGRANRIVGGDEWAEKRLARLAETTDGPAPVYLVPPCGNSVFLYPQEPFVHALGAVYRGAVAIVLSPPGDWNLIKEAVADAPPATSRPAPEDAVHYATLHGVFENLPAGQVMGEPYEGVLPLDSFGEESDEEICGALRLGPDGGAAWTSSILVQRFGLGRIVFTHLRLLEPGPFNPAAERILQNLVRYSAKRGTISTDPLSIHQRIVEWLRNGIRTRRRYWKIIGTFPNWDGAGHGFAYAPETESDFGAAYDGAYGEIRWRDWCSSTEDDPSLELQQAFFPGCRDADWTDHGTAYAYAELHGERRGECDFRVDTPHAVKAWVNGRIAFERIDGGGATFTAPLKQGRNTLLLKVSKDSRPFSVAFEIEDDPEKWFFRWWA